MTLFLKHKLQKQKKKLIKLDKEFKEAINKYNQLAFEYQNQNNFNPIMLGNEQQQQQQAPAEAPPLNIKKDKDTEIVEL